MTKITTREKVKYIAYGLGTLVFILASGSKLDSLMENGNPKKLNNLEVDSIPQVTNYEYIGPIKPLYKDPIKNIYNPKK